MAFENVYISKTEWGRRPGKFQCSLHHYKSSVHLFNFIGASRAVIRAVHNNKTASFLLRFARAQACKPASGGSSLQLLLLTNCPMQPLQQAACLAHWADWQQVNHKKTKQSPLKQKLLALVSKISYLHCISLYVYCWRARSFMRKSMVRQVKLTSCITEISKCLFHVYI